jgi:drug/metabolite transporter (DMT)-like permease
VPVRWAVAVGFLGAGLMLRPSGAAQPAAWIGLAGGMLAAVAMVSVRRLSATEPASRTVFYFAAIAVAISILPLAWFWRTPSAGEWTLLAALGLVATSGQLLLTRAYSLAPAGQIGTFTYSSVIFAALLGWFFWDEGLSVQTWLGALCIVSAGSLILFGRARKR